MKSCLVNCNQRDGLLNSSTEPNLAASIESYPATNADPSLATNTDFDEDIRFACFHAFPAAVNNTPCFHDFTNIHEQICHVAVIPVVVLIFCTNLLALVYSVKSGRFRHPGQWFIAALYVADITVGLTSMGTVVTSTHEASLELCLTRLGFFLSSVLASMHFLMVIAVDRFVAVTQALRYRKLVTSRLAYSAVLSTTTVSLLMGFAPLAGWSSHRYDQHCSFAYTLEPEYIAFIMVASLVPIIVVLAIYVFLYHKAMFHIRKMESILALQRPHHHWVHGMTTQGWKCLRRLVALIGCLLITWSPFIVASILDISSAETPCWLKDVIGTHFLLLGLANCVLNPVIYTLSTRDFRRSLKKCVTTYMC